jgi:hypothetical protein
VKNTLVIGMNLNAQFTLRIRINTMSHIRAKYAFVAPL